MRPVGRALATQQLESHRLGQACPGTRRPRLPASWASGLRQQSSHCR